MPLTGSVTVTSTVPVPGGLVAISRSAPFALSGTATGVTPAAAVLPNCTVEPAENPVPTIVTPVPPDTEPQAGAIPVTVGAAAALAAGASASTSPSAASGAAARRSGDRPSRSASLATDSVIMRSSG